MVATQALNMTDDKLFDQRIYTHVGSFLQIIRRHFSRLDNAVSASGSATRMDHQ